MKKKKKMIGTFMTQDEHDKLRLASVMYGVSMSDIIVEGIKKETLFLELQKEYHKAFVLTKDDDYDREAMIREMVEQKDKIAREFVKRANF